MTNDCNLHCEYCSVLIDCNKLGMPIDPLYSLKQLKEFIIQTQKDQNSDEACICFFGGEPSLRYNKIAELINDFGDRIDRVIVKYVLHTNGLMLNQIPVSVLSSLSLVMHSINYEKIPRYQLMKSYFSDSIEGIDYIKGNSEVATMCRLTVTEKTSIYTEIMLVEHFFGYVYWQIVNCLFFEDFPSFFRTYTYEIKLVFNYWFDQYKKGVFIKLVPFISILKFLFSPDREGTSFICGYGTSMIYVQTDGKCYACSDNVESKEHYIGDIYSGVKLPKPTLSKYKCKLCQYRMICMGRCGRMHVEFSEEHISEYCQLNQFMFNLFIAKKVEIQDIYNNNPNYSNILNDPILEYTEFTP